MWKNEGKNLRAKESKDYKKSVSSGHSRTCSHKEVTVLVTACPRLELAQADQIPAWRGDFDIKYHS